MARSLLLLACFALAGLGLAGCSGLGVSASGGPPLDVSVTASEFKFVPAAVTAAPGQTINLTVKNIGRAQHTFVFKQANVRLTVEPGKTVSQSFKAPIEPGTYPIICDVPGHKDAGMVGELLVK